MSGVNQGNALLNSPTWTISCLLIVECLILGLLLCSKKNFFNFILPVSLVIIFGVWANTDGVNHRKWMGIVNFGVLQVWCSVEFGMLAFFLALKMTAIKKISKLLTAIEVICYAAIFLIMLKWSSFYWGSLLMLLALLAIGITASQRSYTAALIRDTRATRFLGKMSFAIYLNHSVLLKVFKNRLGAELMFERWYVFLIVLMLFSALFCLTMDWIIALGRRCWIKAKNHYDVC